jgi:hypothetical protein
MVASDTGDTNGARPGRGRQVVLVLVAALALLGAGIGIGVLVEDDGGEQEARPVTTTTRATGPASTTTTAAAAFRYQPLYPFRTLDEADAWTRRYATSGDEPWHLDANQTALRFTTEFLRFTEINRVLETRTADDGAHVTVGYTPEDGRSATAAVIHLARFGTGPNAPWEVVGTDDTTLSLTTPPYGARSASPLAVGGRITGVDESLRVEVRQLSSATPLGTSCCLPAGGTGSPWSTSVSYSGAFDPTLTVVVSTGGHVQGVERFAVTGVRTG